MSLDALAAQMNITDAEIEAWAQKKYPQFLANKTLIKRLFLIEKGVRFSAPFQPKELRSINQLVVGETADIQAIVVQELSTRSYIGCPNDSKKIPEAIEGKEAVCPKCGNIVKPKILQWALYLVGDVTDEIIASFPPSIMNRPTEGTIIVARIGTQSASLIWLLAAAGTLSGRWFGLCFYDGIDAGGTATTECPPKRRGSEWKHESPDF